MKISLQDESVQIRWRRVALIGNPFVLSEAGIALTRAKIPHILGRFHPCKSLVARKRAEESTELWLLVPFDKYSDALALLFPLPETRKASNHDDEFRATQT